MNMMRGILSQEKVLKDRIGNDEARTDGFKQKLFSSNAHNKN